MNLFFRYFTPKRLNDEKIMYNKQYLIKKKVMRKRKLIKSKFEMYFLFPKQT